MRRGSSMPQSHSTKNHQRTVVKPPVPPKPIFDSTDTKHFSRVTINQEELHKQDACYNYNKLKSNYNALNDPSKCNTRNTYSPSIPTSYDRNYTYQNDSPQDINKLKKNVKTVTHHIDLVPATVDPNISQEQGLCTHPIISSLAKNTVFIEKLNGVVKKYPNRDELLTRAYSNPETDSSLITINQAIVDVNSYDNQLRKVKYVTPSALHMTTVPKKHYVSYGGVSVNGTNSQKRPNSDIPITTGISTLYTMDQVNPPNIQNGYLLDENMALTREPLQDGGDLSNENIDMPDSIGCPSMNINEIAMISSTYVNSHQHSGKDKFSKCQLTECNMCLENLTAKNNASVNKPTLQKSYAIEIDENYDKKLSRGISRATDNLPLVSKARSELAQGIWDSLDSAIANGKSPYFVETPLFTFTLPDLSVYSDNFRTFLEKDLIETATLVSLETTGRLNWWATIGASQRLWPLATTGDGNCLLHAASLGMWGFHDRLLTLRKALHEFLTKSQYSKPLWRRWRWQLAMQNRKTGLVYNSSEWNEEWQNVIRLASSKPRSENNCQTVHAGDTANDQSWVSMSQGKLDGDGGGHVYESLEEIHVLALCHVLRRPIIVVADVTLKDVNGAPLAPIPFGGIYLPLECPPKECQKSPLLLTYDAAHFSALVVMETSDQSSLSHLPAVIPVTDNQHDLLPIQFLIDPGEEFGWGKDEYDKIFIEKLMITPNDQRGLLSEYLNLVQVPIPSTYLDPPPYYNVEDTDVVDATHDSDKKSSESSFDSDDGRALSDSGATKTKSKQIQTVVRQFGSIGRSMSKRIKKNLNTLSKLSRTGSFRSKNRAKGDHFGGKAIRICTQQSYILVAEIHIEKRKAYQEEMIKNYLNNAKRRFKVPGEPPRKEVRAERALDMRAVDRMQCVNSGCTLFATAETSYLCSVCYERQKIDEEYHSNTGTRTPLTTRASGASVSTSDPKRHNAPQYRAGRSKFYTDLDATAVETASHIPVTNSISAYKDRTLYLSNSVFYNDSNMSIPSYNLQKSKNTQVLQDNRSCLNTNTTSSKSNVVYTSTNSGSANKQVASIAPISIDDAFHSDALRQSPQWCMTSGCEFFGNPSMDSYCSKCFSKKKGSTKAVVVERNEASFCK